MMSLAMDCVSCELRHSSPLNLSSVSWPLTSTCGARPGEKIRSLTWELDFSMAETNCAVWIFLCPAGADDAAGVCAGATCGGHGCVDGPMHCLVPLTGPTS